jgi:signal transduction histidine kinase
MRLSELIQQNSISTLTEQGEMEPSSNSVQNLQLILDIVKQLNNSLILSDVLELVLDHAIIVTKAERGILLFADEGPQLRCVLARNADRKSLDIRAVSYSTTIANDVFQSGELICIENAQSDGLYDKRQSVKSLELETILCAPLTVEDQKIGVIYVDSRYIHSVNRQEIIDLFEIFTGQAATAIRNAKLYEKLQDSYRELQGANEQLIKFERLASRGEMAAEISHELRNQLGLAMLELDLLKSYPRNYSPAVRKRKIGSALKILKRISAFAANLIESSAFKTVKKKNDLNKVVSEFLKFIKTFEKFSRLNITLSPDESLPDFLFDANQIQQVFLNLLKNTIEACSDAAVHIAISFDPKTKVVEVSFKDNGPGISEEVRKKLFSEKLSMKEHGHGYGLSICARIIENHGGAISVKSRPGQGAEFVFSLPAQAY